jgi:hypothetical protein
MRMNRRGVIALVALGAIATLWFARSMLDPFCTYRLNARIEATIEVGGKLYNSNAVYRASQSRDWISGMNSAGCIETKGTALVFKLDKGAVILVPNGLCPKAERAFISEGRSDVVADCEGKPRPDGDAFALDSGTNPTLWQPLTWDDNVKLISMKAERSFGSPNDLLDQNAPSVLDAGFDDNGDWWASPERVITFWRRYNKNEPYRFQVQLGQFNLF